ncbi:MAG: hypothetical protein ACOX4U_03765 [Anaerovoracaceae bacterium]
MKKILMTVIIAGIMIFSTVFTFANGDNSISIVSPGQTVYGSTLLISVKITSPQTVQISAYEQKQTLDGVLIPIDPDKISSVNVSNIKSVSIMEKETYKCVDNLRFYNKQINNVAPGLYKIVVETKNGDKVASTTSTLTVVRPADEDKSVSFEAKQGALKRFQNFIKGIFGG